MQLPHVLTACFFLSVSLCVGTATGVNYSYHIFIKIFAYKYLLTKSTYVLSTANMVPETIMSFLTRGGVLLDLINSVPISKQSLLLKQSLNLFFNQDKLPRNVSSTFLPLSFTFHSFLLSFLHTFSIPPCFFPYFFLFLYFFHPFCSFWFLLFPIPLLHLFVAVLWLSLTLDQTLMSAKCRTDSL